MKTKKLFGILSLLIIIGVTSCNSDTPQDNVENIKMKVSSEIGTYQPWGSDHFIDCMLVKEEGKNEYEALDFLGIAGFDYSNPLAELSQCILDSSNGSIINVI